MTKVQCLQYNRFTDVLTGIEFHSILDRSSGLNIGVAEVAEKDLKRFKDQPEQFKILSNAEYQQMLGLSVTAHAHGDDPTEGAPADPSHLHKLSEGEEESHDKPSSRRRRGDQTIEEAAQEAALEGMPSPPESA